MNIVALVIEQSLVNGCYLVRFAEFEQIEPVGVPLLDHVSERLAVQHALVRRVHRVTSSSPPGNNTNIFKVNSINYQYHLYHRSEYAALRYTIHFSSRLITKVIVFPR